MCLVNINDALKKDYTNFEQKPETKDNEGNKTVIGSQDCHTVGDASRDCGEGLKEPHLATCGEVERGSFTNQIIATKHDVGHGNHVASAMTHQHCVSVASCPLTEAHNRSTC